MIAFLRGVVLAKSEGRVVLDVSGVGYEVLVTGHAAARLPEAGGEARLWVEESFGMYGGGVTLYGFLTEHERRLFRALRDHVPSTGARKALEALDKASKSLPDFRRAVLDRDARLLSAAFGFTRKSAERLIEGLRDHIGGLAMPGAERLRPADGIEEGPVLSQALGALTALGYRASEAREALQAASPGAEAQPPSAELLVRRALKRLGGAPA